MAFQSLAPQFNSTESIKNTPISDKFGFKQFNTPDITSITTDCKTTVRSKTLESVKPFEDYSTDAADPKSKTNNPIILSKQSFQKEIDNFALGIQNALKKTDTKSSNST